MNRTHFATTAFSTLTLAALFLFSFTASASAADANAQKLTDARDVYQELLSASDRSVPQSLRDGCRCVAVIPHVLKGAIGIGGRYGKGAMSCRDTSGRWSAPSFLKLAGGSFGFQLGGESTDLVLFFMTERGARSLVDSKFTLGAAAGVAAGPVGRSGEASTDVALKAEIYSYAKSKGAFAGLSLEGSRLAPDDSANKAYYGTDVTAKKLLFEGASVSSKKEAEAFVRVLP
jgi:lipid-binding SYLF domain-containing protein